jgi:MFS superfamily sulfate permease-like transporter
MFFVIFNSAPTSMSSINHLDGYLVGETVLYALSSTMLMGVLCVILGLATAGALDAEFARHKSFKVSLAVGVILVVVSFLVLMTQPTPVSPDYVMSTVNSLRSGVVH